MNKIYYILIVICLLLSSCKSDIESIKEDNNIPADLDSIICCTQPVMKELDMANRESHAQTRGWEGDVPPGAQFPSLTYPLDEIYLYVDDGWGYEYTIYHIPLKKSGDNKYFDVCYRVKNQHIYATINDQEILVGPNLSCFLASTPNIINSLDKSTITTPSGHEAYEPFGDRLFRSDSFGFKFNPRTSKILNLNNVPVENITDIKMLRGTSVLITALIICDKYPPLDADGNPVIEGSVKMSDDVFISRLGPIKYWSMRVYATGKKDNEASGVPIEYNITNTLLGMQGSPVFNGPKGTQALSNKILPFGDIKKTTGTPQFKEFTYAGIGAYDDSYPFIYWSNDLSKIDLCFTLYYTGPKDNGIKYDHLTLRFPLTGNMLNNNIVMKTIVIDIDDVESAFKDKKFLPDESRSLNKVYWDDDFGRMFDIPVLGI